MCFHGCIAGFLLVLIYLRHIQAGSSCLILECESKSRQYGTCSVSQISANQAIVSTTVKEQLSNNNDCVFGDSFGFLTTSIWVDKGCRAKFRICFSYQPIDGNWSNWSNWGQCTLTCGGGTKARSRSCDNPAPAHGGQDCSGDSTETATCNTQVCPIDGNWSNWSNWGQCTLTCGGGTKIRSRACDSPAPAHGGLDCSGDSTETATCNTHVCPTDGNWSNWSDWGQCTLTCGGGTKIRSRACDNPIPAHGGNNCYGYASDSPSCNIEICPVDGGWGSWSVWGTCPVTCGGGKRTRARRCDNPAPLGTGNDCGINSIETEDCGTVLCPVNGNWGNWTQWNECSATCGNGTTFRTRLCDDPVPSHGGQPCNGDSSENSTCQFNACPDSTLDQCTCPCSLDNRWNHLFNNLSTTEELLTDLHIDPKTTNMAKRKKTSAEDDRLSSAVMGWTGAFTCFMPFAFSALIDLLNYLK